MLVFVRADPWRCGLMLVCLLLAAAAEGIGLSSLLPLLGFVTRSAQGEAAAASAHEAEGFERVVVDAVARTGLEPTPQVLLWAIVVAMLVKAALVMIAKTQVGYTVAQVATDMRLRLIRALLASRWSFFQRESIGFFSNSFATEARRASNAFLAGTTMTSHVIQVVLYSGIACATSWRAALIALPIGLATLALPDRLVRLTRRAGHRQTELLKDITRLLTDVFQGVKPLKAMARGNLVGPLLERGTQQLNKALRREVLTKEAVKTSQEPLLVVCVAVGLYFATTYFQMQLATVTLLALVFIRAVTSMAKAQRQYQQLVTDESAYWSMVEMVEHAESEREESSGTVAPRLESAVELRDVSFAYDSEPVLEHVSVEIPAGAITALVGASGSGKTTLVDLIVGLAEPDSGAVLVDGVPLAEIDLTAWRRLLGYVPQEMFLLNDTIATNVSLGDAGVTRADVERALRDAGAWEFVERLPEGMDGTVGERGSQLSGGQRQRIAIARALVHRPRLLVLDEATAPLDQATEQALWATMDALRGKTTILAISHGTAVLDVADRVYRLDAGRADELGPGAGGEAAMAGVALS